MTKWRRAILLVVISGAIALAVWPLALRLPNFVVPDDGYFYARIAMNLALEGRSTFDGIHTTSGYHLPWAIVLAGVSRIVGCFTRAPEHHLFFHLWLSLALILATVRHFFRSPLVQLAALAILVANFSLTEMALAAPLVLGLLRAHLLANGGRNAAWLAVALALVRVDLACVPAVLALSTSDRPRALRLLAGTLLGVGLQLGLMRICFGHYFSVAAELKTAGALSRIGLHVLQNLTASTFVAFTYVTQALLAALAVLLRRQRTTIALVLCVLSFIVVHVTLSIVRPWYPVPVWMGLLFTLEYALAAPDPPRALVRGSIAIVGLLTVAWVIHSARVELVYAGDQRSSQRFLAELKGIVPRGTPIFTFDNPGYLGFLSGLRVVDGDGLVNDYDYARRLRKHALAGYLDEEGICWIVTDYADAMPVINRGGLALGREEIFKLIERRHQYGTQADFILYRLTEPRCSITAR